ncbi:MAG: hypothetical protein IT447_07720 [Phycisphaerales bacterium]|jgi:anti-sigma regulatory factor (Ser/Thr protein kinase)|nr:hypothetical protein [Phycisphaerales bacterium]
MPNGAVHCEIDFQVNDSPKSVVTFLKRIRGIFDPNTKSWSIDFSKCKYLGPDAVAIVVAAVEESRRNGVNHEVILPKGNASLEAFCEFSGLNHLLRGTAIPSGNHPDNVTIPYRVQHKAGFNDPDPVIQLIGKFVQLSPETEEYLRICVNEVIQNVEDHAHSRIGCVTCARFLQNIGEVRVAIVDLGRGIGTTLRGIYPDASNVQALERVLQGGYSAKSRSNNMGMGISNLCQIILHQLRGELFIVTEDAFADGKARERPVSQSLGMNFPGTGIFFGVPVK